MGVVQPTSLYKNYNSSIIKNLSQSSQLWSILLNLHLSHQIKPVDHLVHDLIALAHQLDDNLLQTVTTNQLFNSDDSKSELTDSVGNLINFYSLPDYSPTSLTQQLLTHSFHKRPSRSHNYFSTIAEEIDSEPDTMEIDNETNPAPNTSSISWSTDSGITEIAGNLFTQMIHSKKRAADAGELEGPNFEYKKPAPIIDCSPNIKQQI